MKSKHSSVAGVGITLLACGPADAAFTGITAAFQDVTITEGGFGDATVIRLYAAFDNSDDQLTQVFGDSDQYPLSIATDDLSPWFQHSFGSDDATAQNPVLFPVFPDIAYDSYLEIGRTLSTQGGTVSFGPPFPPSNWGDNGILAPDYANWNRNPADPLTIAGPDLEVLFAQITVRRGARLGGVVNFITFQDGVAAQEFGVTFDVPAPGGIGVLGLALIGTRRRRRT